MEKQNVEVEGGEILIQSKEGHYAVIPAKHRQEVMDMVKEGCDDCINDYIKSLPKDSDYAEDGTLLEKIKSSKLNPKNWGVDDYTDKGDFDSAYSTARQSEEKEFMWNNKRYSTNYKGTSKQQLEETGIIDDEINNIKTANTVSNMLGNVGKYFFNIDDEDLIESNYKPTKTSNKQYYKWNEKTQKNEAYIPEQKYYTRKGMKNDVFKDLTSEEVRKIYNHSSEFNDIFNALKSDGTDRKHDADNAFPKNKAGYNGMYNLGHGSFKGEFNLGRYIVDAGYDENGRYISFSDRYDWNGTEQNGKYPTYNEKSINFYDRIYENEWHRFQNKKYTDEELSELDVDKKNFDTIALQTALSNRGYKLPKSTKKDGNFDGVLGEETKAALLDYQTINKSKSIVDKATRVDKYSKNQY